MRDARRALADFAGGPQAEDSPLYGALTDAIMKDEFLFDVTSRTPAGQPIPLHVLAAIQYVLMDRPAEELAAYYPNLTAEAREPDGRLPAILRAFVADHRSRIERLLAERSVQTNEVGRMGVLMPGLCYIHQRTEKPLSVIEIGCSAGLLLGWEDYFFDYGRAGSLGDPDADVVLRPELRGRGAPPISGGMPPTAIRIGIDLAPLDATDPADADWLRALVWPEHAKRRERLNRALETVAKHPPRLVAGDAIHLLPELLGRLDPGSTRVVMHSIALYQFERPARDEIDRILREAGETGPVYRLEFEFNPGEKGVTQPFLRLRSYADGTVEEEEILAAAQYHGRWLEWLLPTS